MKDLKDISVGARLMSETIRKIQEHQLQLEKDIQSPFLELAKSLQKQQEQLKKSAEAPLVKLAKDMKNQQDRMRAALESPILNIARQIQAQQENLRAQALAPLYKTIKELTNQGNAMRSIMQLPALASMSQSMSISAPAVEVPTKFIWQVLDHLNSTKGNLGADALEHDVSTIENYISDQCNLLVPDQISYEGMLSLYLAIISILLTLYFGFGSDQTIKKTVAESENRIVKKIEEIKPKESKENIFYVVENTVNLRAKPTTKSTKLDLLYPGQRVTLLDAKGKWIYIKYFDYIEGIPKMGWVFKKYLKRLKINFHE